MLVKIGDTWVLEDFIISDMAESDDGQIIRSRHLVATSGCQTNVRRGRTTLKVQGCHAMFCHMEQKAVSPYYSSLDEFLPSPNIDMENILNCQDPPDLD